MSLLDIGCGWGFLLIEAAKKYGVHGMGITLSKEQYKEFQRRIAEEHLGQLLTVELMDYRDIPKCGRNFDRIVSVGMVEHVGRDNYQLFMDCAREALNPGGLFLLLLHFISALKDHQEIYLSWRCCSGPAGNAFLCGRGRVSHNGCGKSEAPL